MHLVLVLLVVVAVVVVEVSKAGEKDQYRAPVSAVAAVDEHFWIFLRPLTHYLL